MSESFLGKLGSLFKGTRKAEAVESVGGSETFTVYDDGFPLVKHGATQYFNALNEARNSLPKLDVNLENLGDTGGSAKGIRFKVTSGNPRSALEQLKKKAEELRDEVESSSRG